MTESMGMDRFRALADAYGGVIARWPESVRDAAASLATEPEARAILTDAGRLDAALDAWRMHVAAPDLAASVAAAAIGTGRRLRRRARAWWSGLGIAAALAGAAAGTGVAAAIVPTADQSEVSGTFGDLGPDAS